MVWVEDKSSRRDDGRTEDVSRCLAFLSCLVLSARSRKEGGEGMICCECNLAVFLARCPLFCRANSPRQGGLKISPLGVLDASRGKALTKNAI